MTNWRDLVRQGKFAEAEPLMLAETEQETIYGYEVISRAGFYENWGDSFGSKNEAKELYEKSLSGYQLFAFWATSGGEGTARMIDVKRVEKKIAGLDK